MGLLAAIGLAAAVLPPVTQAEAIAFHANGLCQMMVPGKGLTRADGDGWIVSSLPGRHRIYAPAGSVTVRGAEGETLDMTPGKPYRVHVEPGGTPLYWCPQFKPADRGDCGPVPEAFLYDAAKARP